MCILLFSHVVYIVNLRYEIELGSLKKKSFPTRMNSACTRDNMIAHSDKTFFDLTRFLLTTTNQLTSIAALCL